jgi:xanthine/CO dehydrogenase XdhC/CoxF family maturation factor
MLERRPSSTLDHHSENKAEPPMLAPDSDILRKAQEWKEAGRDIALATVVETWGSVPRPVGSHLLIDSEGNFLGSVFGGCVEGDVITDALDMVATGGWHMLEFGVADETAWRAGLSCGGRDQGLCVDIRLAPRRSPCVIQCRAHHAPALRARDQYPFG